MTVRPKLNAYTTYSLIPDGIYLRNNRTSLNLRGKNLDRFFELLPSLNGHYTLEEITQGLSADKKMLITKFLEILLRSGFLKDMSQHQTDTLTQAELTTYSSNIAFIDSFQTAAASRFASFCNRQILVIGSGPGFTALVQACLRSGIKQINIIRTPECETLTEAQSAPINQLSPNDHLQKIQLLPPPRWDNESDMLNTIHTCDVLIHISDRPMLARAQMLNRLCIEQKKTFIQAIVVDDHVWIGPLVSAETKGGCWECAWRRLQSNLATNSENDHTSFRDHATVAPDQSLTLPIATITANRLIFELFNFNPEQVQGVALGVDSHHHKSIIDERNRQDLVFPRNICWLHARSPESISERHIFLPHPHCHACQQLTTPTEAQFLNHIQQLQHQAPLDPAKLCENIARNVDHCFGLFTSLDTDDFVQAPIAVYKVGLSNPMHLQHPDKPLEVIETGTDRNSARVNACQRACEHYATRLVDHRQLLHSNAIQQQSLPAVPVDQMIGVPPLPKNVETWTWALDLHTQQACLIPAPLAFPSLLHEEFRVEDERGIGSGMSWAEAVCQALFDWCTFLALEEVRDAQQQYPQVDLTTIPMTPEGEHLHRLLQIADEQVAVYDVTGTLQVPTLAIYVGENIITYSTHCDIAQALSTGLRQAMQQYQARKAQQPGYAVTPVPDLLRQAQAGRNRRTTNPTLVPQPLHAPTDNPRWRVPYQTPPEAWSAREEWLLQTLQEHHLHAWAIPLDHDPALRQIFPHIVRMLLTKI